MTHLRSMSEYRRAIKRIRLLQDELSDLAKTMGNLDPNVLAVSQEIDEYIVAVQQYWHDQDDEVIS